MGDARQAAEVISPTRRAIDSTISQLVDRFVHFLVAHWVLLVNTGVAVFAFLPFLAPYLFSIGLTEAGQAIYTMYSYTCHQLPERSWFLFGHQMAYCQRDAAIYPAAFLAGLVFGARRGRVPRLSFKAYLLLILPMAVDGTGQLIGLWESTGFTRTLTGSLFGVASVWLTYPYLKLAIEDLEA